ncbi:MAG TPA: nickel pincer cofactor biosynthesis protein LarB [Clostridia bacterium]|jgi:NCAIR mutase (PurE)-related protein|nr:nickel pincer cofactor biosynthesis protein LarB [Clostridia bacterium]
MRENPLKALLNKLKNNEISVEDALAALKKYYYEDIGYARVDHQRAMRSGIPEVIFGLGKTPEQVAGIASALWGKGAEVLVTKATQEQFTAVKNVIPSAVFHKTPRLITSSPLDLPGVSPAAAVLSAGTADIPVAEEAAVSLEFFRIGVIRIYDVGVAGLHRLIDRIEDISACKAVIAVAGMDGALPSVVAGMIDVPVIAVPTSIGYGASFSGAAALLTMLNSCAPGIGVVNIDNGFGAAALTHAIIRSGGR